MTTRSSDRHQAFPCPTRAIMVSAISAAALAVCLLVAPTAFAVTGHTLKTSFGTSGHVGEPGSGAGQLAVSSYSGLAVNETSHDVYVDDSGNHRVSEFSATGTFISAFGADVGGPGIDVCAAVCLGGTAGTAPGEFEFATSLAIDNSQGSGQGDVYVADFVDSTVTKFESDGTLVSSWATGGQLVGAGEGFKEIAGIAVDADGDLVILNTEGMVFEFEPNGTFSTSFKLSTPPEFEGVEQGGLGIDGDGDLFKINRFIGGEIGSGVEKFDSNGIALGRVTRKEVGGITVDSGGDLLTSTGFGASIDSYTFDGSGDVIGATPPCPLVQGGSCSPTVNFGEADLSQAKALAADGSTGTLYAVDIGTQEIVAFSPLSLPDATTEAASAVTKESALLHGTVSAAAGPVASCKFQITTESAFEGEGFTGAETLACNPPGPFAGTASAAVSAEASGLDADATYVYRIVATSSNGSYPELESRAGALNFRTSGPGVLATNATAIADTAATLTGVIDTRGIATTYHFEIGPTSAYGTSVPVSEGTAVTPVGTGDPQFNSIRIFNVSLSQGSFVVGQEVVGEGISAGTKVTSIEGSTLNLSKPVVTASSGVALSSPSASASARVEGLAPGTEYHFRLVATNAEATAAGPDTIFSSYPTDTGLPDGRAYELVSPALKSGEVFPPEPNSNLGTSCPLLCVPGAYEPTMPMQPDPDGESIVYEGQAFSVGLSAGANQYLAQRSPGGWDTSPITPPQAPGFRDGSGFKEFSADLTRGVLLQSTPSLSPEAPGEKEESFTNLYLWEAGNPQLRPLVTVEPPNRGPYSPGPNTNPDAFSVYFAGGNAGTPGSPALGHLVFEANDALTGAVPDVAPAAPEVGAGGCGGDPGSECNLYEWDAGQLRLINVLPGNGSAAVGATIGSGRRLPDATTSVVDHAISNDGSEVFWSDAAGQVYVRIDGKETIKINDPGEGQFLAASPDGSKVLLSDGCLYSLQSGACEANLTDTAAGFLGIMGASENLSRVYFVSPEALATGAEPRACVGTTTELGPGLGCNLYVYDDGEVRFVTAVPTSDNLVGSSFRFGSWHPSPANRTAQVTSDGKLLAFMSGGSLAGYDSQGLSEVYEYDLQTKNLSCASCDPAGLPPLGSSNLSLLKTSPDEAPAAAFPQPQNLPVDGEGRLFFETRDVLSAGDANGHVQDVYEWTPDGIGSCERAKGCIALISSGHSSVDSMFVNATPSGDDAFFITRQQLLPADRDDQLDVYDARVGGGIDEGAAEPCGGEVCKGPATLAAAGASPGSSATQPPSQVKPCNKASVRRHGKCVKKTKHHKHNGKKHNQKKHNQKKHHKHGGKSKKHGQHNRGGSK